MSTVGQLMEKTRRRLWATHRPTLNQLASAIEDDTGSLTVTHGTRMIGPGSYLAIDDEIVYVWESAAAPVYTIERGMLGTTPAAHDANALIEVNSRFPRGLIRDTLVEEILSWPRSVFRVVTKDLTLAANQTAVDLDIDGDFYTPLRVMRSPRPGEDEWFEMHFRYAPNMPTTTFASGHGLFFDDLNQLGTAVSLRVTYAAPFDVSEFDFDATDLQDDVGLGARLEDVPTFGAVWRLLGSFEIPRANAAGQGEPRNAEEVPPGYMMQMAESFRKVRDERLKDEATALLHDYPYRWSR